MNLNTKYIPLARKYRPNSFSELVGQEVLVKILNYAIKNNRISPAYLFHGSRGIGKTTTARIVAKLLNCENRKYETKKLDLDKVLLDELLVACDECNNCKNFANHPDVIELDAASNTGVDDARLMINNSEYIPLIGKYKVFIIDEVHMLSKSAFNALLKTLEEPNESAIFILATTEINKIPLTVISRCQRFDLKRFAQKEIKKLLADICKKENISYEDGSLEVIAQKSYGSARDAISILEQANIATLSGLDTNPNTNLDTSRGNSITQDLIYSILGVVGTSEIINMLSRIINRDIKALSSIIDSLETKNVDFVILAQDMLELLLFLSKIKILGSSEIDFDSCKYNLGEINKILALCNTDKLMIFLQIFSKNISEIKEGYDQKIYFEMTCIKCSYAVEIPNLKQIINSNNEADEAYENTKVRIEKIDNKDKIKDKLILSNEIKKDENKIKKYSILKYLYQKNEFELYYYLMNKCSFEVSGENLLTIKTDKIETDINSKIQSALNEMNNSKWKINVVKEISFTSYKQMLNKNFADSDVYKLITENFSNPKIVDILFDNSNL